MAYSVKETCRLIARANRIIAHEGVLDAFGHVSARHPERPDRYLLSRSLAPSLVTEDDILEFDLDSKVQQETSHSVYGECVIHGEIYRARPDVMAVCHHHSPSILPFCVTDRKLVPVYQLGAVMGPEVPLWDSRDEFGDTNLLLTKPAEGKSLARTLGRNWLVLMRHHGATCVSHSLQDMTFRTIYSAANAELLLRAMAIGTVDPLTAGETALAGETRPLAVEKSWNYWDMRCPK